MHKPEEQTEDPAMINLLCFKRQNKPIMHIWVIAINLSFYYICPLVCYNNIFPGEGGICVIFFFSPRGCLHVQFMYNNIFNSFITFLNIETRVVSGRGEEK